MDREILYKFFSGEATEAQEARVIEWLDDDPANRERMMGERRLFDAMLMHAGERRDGSREGLREGLRGGVRRMARVPRLVRAVARYAAVVAVTVGVGALWLSLRGQETTMAVNTISVPAGQRVDVVLADGTKVCMNALSKMEYPSSWAGGERRVRLSGEAFFDVARDEGKVFVVETFAGDVKVLGTKFNVEAREEMARFTTSLVEGRVSVTGAGDAGSVELRAGQQLDLRNGVLVAGLIPEHEQFQWREGLIAFREASFMELIAEFEQYFGVEIVVPAGREFPTAHFTGKIRISEGIDHAMWVLGQSVDFKYSRNDSKQIIYIH